MPLLCPAHDGHVIKLIGSCDPIQLSTNQDLSSLASSALVSYGSDNMLNIWVLSLERETTLVLHLQMCILMDLIPVHFKLLDSMVCVTLIDHSLLMFPVRASWKSDNRLITTSCSFSKLQSLKHQLEDEHTDAILSLEASTVLGLLVTSSNDGLIKIWNKENQLVSEMLFGRELSSACFLNPKGDLLVGFQKNIRVVQAEDYLPAHYLEIGRGYPHSEVNEAQISFDPDLQFWYDAERIPSLPPQQETRNQYLQTHPGVSTLQSLLKASTSSNCIIAEDSESVKSGASSLERSGASLQSKVDSTLAQELSRHYFMELSEQKPCTKIRRFIPYQVCAFIHVKHSCTLLILFYCSYVYHQVIVKRFAALSLETTNPLFQLPNLHHRSLRAHTLLVAERTDLVKLACQVYYSDKTLFLYNVNQKLLCFHLNHRPPKCALHLMVSTHTSRSH